jgi:hypothetical protein
MAERERERERERDAPEMTLPKIVGASSMPFVCLVGIGSRMRESSVLACLS